MNSWFKRVLLLCLSIILLAANVSPTIAQATQNNLSPRYVPVKPVHTKIMGWESRQTIQVKFVEGSAYRLRNGNITTLRSDPLGGLKAVFEKHPVKQIERLFTLSEDQIDADKLESETLSNEQMPDLNLWYQISVQDGTDPEALIDALNALPEVEIASPAPLPAPLPTELKNSYASDLLAPEPPPSPNYLSQQGYLNAATNGINAKYAWGLPGGKGSNVTIVDIEYSFNKTHEDLPTIPLIGGKMWNYFGDDHATAVLGEMVGKNNSYGIKGIAYAAHAKFSSPCMDSTCDNYNLPNAINTARTHTTYGDVILIEQQTPVCNLPDGYYGPMEWYSSIFDAIKLATAAGRNVVEAAGNGNVNLDDAGCNNKFNKNLRDSGAIIVGAGSPPNYTSQVDRSRLYYSTYGSRVDVQGWGFNVVSSGYGDLYTGAGKNHWYTSSFSGTSSSSPIVAGAAAILSSIAQQRGLKIGSAWIRTTLKSTGSPQRSDPSYPASQHIGPRPNLIKAIAKLGPNFASQFNANASGWSKVKGTWNINSSAFYKTTGIVNKWSSIKHKDQYTTVDYQVRMKRTGCLDCANGILIRGTLAPLKTTFEWNKGYVFEYNNARKFSVWELKPGGKSALKNWTTSTKINVNNWNILRVIANGQSLKFYINGSLVWTGSDPTLKTGYLGIVTYRNASPEIFLVDWAKLKNTLP